MFPILGDWSHMTAVRSVGPAAADEIGRNRPTVVDVPLSVGELRYQQEGLQRLVGVGQQPSSQKLKTPWVVAGRPGEAGLITRVGTET